MRLVHKPHDALAGPTAGRPPVGGEPLCSVAILWAGSRRLPRIVQGAPSSKSVTRFCLDFGPTKNGPWRGGAVLGTGRPRV